MAFAVVVAGVLKVPVDVLKLKANLSGEDDLRALDDPRALGGLRALDDRDKPVVVADAPRADSVPTG